MKNDNRLVRWFPKQMFDRYKAVEKCAYEIRRSVKHKTRVRVGREDIELCTKETGSSAWRRQPLPGTLPRIEMAYIPSSFMPSSPPPGRPGRAKMLAEAIAGVVTSSAGQFTIQKTPPSFFINTNFELPALTNCPDNSCKVAKVSK